LTIDFRLSTIVADRYRIERELGQGGMATVYLAEDQNHRRKVAIKVVRADRFVFTTQAQQSDVWAMEVKSH
jgi:serine/threonine-protein kinase